MGWGKTPKRITPGGKPHKRMKQDAHREHRPGNATNRRALRIVATRDIEIEDVVFRDRLRPVRAKNVAKLASR